MGQGVKMCIHCGADCAKTRRFKDQLGRYVCGDCYDGLRADLVPQGAAAHAAAGSIRGGSPDPLLDPIPLAEDEAGTGEIVCPRCSKTFSNAGSVCPKCQYDTAIGAAPPPPSLLVPRPCANCGYDLKGLPLTTICPECGQDAETSSRLKRQGLTESDFKTFYMEPLRLAAIGLVALAIIRVVAHDPKALLIDLVAIAFSVPTGLAAYWVFCVLWSGFDQAWSLAAVNLLAVFSISWAVNALFLYVPVPVVGWGISLAVYYGMLVSRLELEDWKEAFVLSLLLRLVQLGALLGVALVISLL